MEFGGPEVSARWPVSIDLPSLLSARRDQVVRHSLCWRAANPCLSFGKDATRTCELCKHQPEAKSAKERSKKGTQEKEVPDVLGVYAPMLGYCPSKQFVPKPLHKQHCRVATESMRITGARRSSGQQNSHRLRRAVVAQAWERTSSMHNLPGPSAAVHTFGS